MPIVLNDTKRKARKDHICNYCGGKILHGETYYYQSGINSDNDFYTWKSHVHCNAIADYMFKYGDYFEGIGEDSFHDEILVKCKNYNVSSKLSFQEKALSVYQAIYKCVD